MEFDKKWLDKFGFPLPQPSDSDKSADNAVMFLSVAMLLGFDFPNYKDQVRSCYLKTGLVARWPGNNYDNCAWDDYLGIAAACIKLKITDIPREILWYGIVHAFIYNTDKKLEGKDFLGRNVPIWPMMICAAYPILKYLIYPFMWVVQKFFESPRAMYQRNYTSGIQLQWVYLEAARLLGFKFKSLYEHENLLAEAMLVYYHKDHPFNKIGRL